MANPESMAFIWEEREAKKWSKKAAIKIAAHSGNKKALYIPDTSPN